MAAVDGRTLAVLAAALLAAACGLREPSAPATPHAPDVQASMRTVLYIGTLEPAQAQRTLATLDRELKRAALALGPLQLAQEHLGSSSATDIELRAKVAQAYAAHKPHLVFAATPRVARLAQGVDAKTPIVFEGSSDPRLNCLVDDLLKPGRNATGYMAHVPMAAKMVEALVLAYPAVQEVVVLVDGNERGATPCSAGQAVKPAPTTCTPGWLDVNRLGSIAPSVREAVQAVQARGLATRALQLCDAPDLLQLPQWLGSRKQGQAPITGVMVPMQHLYYAKTPELVAALKPLAWPAVYPRWRWAQIGGLMALSPTPERYPAERATEVALRILDGARAQETPVQFPDGLQWTFNAHTAQEQGLKPDDRALRRVHRFLP